MDNIFKNNNWMSSFEDICKDLIEDNKPPHLESCSVDSEIEDIFRHNIIKFLKNDVKIFPQYEIKKPFNFRIDFAIEYNDTRIGIECDGADYHNLYRDSLRDLFILNYNNVDEMIRFPGRAINHSVYNCIYILYEWHPYLFNEDKIENLLILSDDEFKTAYEYEKKGIQNGKMFYDSTEFFFNHGYMKPKLHFVQYFIDHRKKKHIGKHYFNTSVILSFFENNPGIKFEDIVNEFPDFEFRYMR